MLCLLWCPSFLSMLGAVYGKPANPPKNHKWGTEESCSLNILPEDWKPEQGGAHVKDTCESPWFLAHRDFFISLQNNDNTNSLSKSPSKFLSNINLLLSYLVWFTKNVTCGSVIHVENTHIYLHLWRTATCPTSSTCPSSFFGERLWEIGRNQL